MRSMDGTWHEAAGDAEHYVQAARLRGYSLALNPQLQPQDVAVMGQVRVLTDEGSGSTPCSATLQ
jgi:hypothetical protein